MIANAREAYTNYKVKLTKKIEELKEELAKLEKKKKRKKPKETEKKAEIKLTETKLEEAPAVEKQIESLAKRIGTEQVNLLYFYNILCTTYSQLYIAATSNVTIWPGAHKRSSFGVDR